VLRLAELVGRLRLGQVAGAVAQRGQVQPVRRDKGRLDLAGRQVQQRAGRGRGGVALAVDKDAVPSTEESGLKPDRVIVRQVSLERVEHNTLTRRATIWGVGGVHLGHGDVCVRHCTSMPKFLKCLAS
jgi:hypothetical protein